MMINIQKKLQKQYNSINNNIFLGFLHNIIIKNYCIIFLNYQIILSKKLIIIIKYYMYSVMFIIHIKKICNNMKMK